MAMTGFERVVLLPLQPHPHVRPLGILLCPIQSSGDPTSSVSGRMSYASSTWANIIFSSVEEKNLKIMFNRWGFGPILFAIHVPPRTRMLVVTERTMARHHRNLETFEEARSGLVHFAHLRELESVAVLRS
jgi:hypothetical protein